MVKLAAAAAALGLAGRFGTAGAAPVVESAALPGDEILYLSLWSEGREVSGGGYARTPFSPWAAERTAVGWRMTNRQNVSFPEPTADWGVVDGFALHNQQGELLNFGAIDDSCEIYLGWKQPTFAPGAISINMI